MCSSQPAQSTPLESLSVAEVAALWHCTPLTVRREISRGALRVFHVGRCVRVPWQSITEYMERGQDNA